MSWIHVQTADGVAAFGPGDTVRGEVDWSFDQAPARIELRLFWRTTGKGDEDLGVIERRELPQPQAVERREFAMQLPREGPHSFSGQLISLLWAIEVQADPMGDSDRIDLIVAPGGQEKHLEAAPDAAALSPEMQAKIEGFVGRLGIRRADRR